MTTALVLGAGISGLTAARLLAQAGIDFTLLEARDDIGGRALSVDVNAGALDLGPAWVWPAMQPQIKHLIDELKLQTLEQYETGDFLFESNSGIQRGPYPKRYADARRLRNGIQGIARRLKQDLPDNNLRTGAPVSGLTFNDKHACVHLDSGEQLNADFVISTIPGPILTQLDINPALPANLSNELQRHPTWMAAHAKVLLVYPEPFWRQQGLSGSCVSHLGPLFEIADQSDAENDVYALFGFVGWPAQQRRAAKRADDKALENAVLDQLERLFGEVAKKPVSFHTRDWAEEAFTTTEKDMIAPSGHPRYGSPLFEQPYADGRLYLAGAETSIAHGGLIEGAIDSGIRAANAIIANTR